MNIITLTDRKLPFSFWINSMLSLRFISNLTILVCILSYYMNAYKILFIFTPLLIINLIVITSILFTNSDDFINNIIQKYFVNKEDIEKYKVQIIIVIILWHLLPIVWLFYILNKYNLIKLFRPNFMGIYFKSISIAILYFYYQSNEKLYGNINYLLYFIYYIILLLSTCIYLYLE